MAVQRLRKLLREPVWCVLVGCLIVGVILGTLAARETTDEVLAAVVGRAWRKTAIDARSFLMTLFGLHLTVLTIVLMQDASMIQSAANQYSPRLVPYYLKKVPFRKALPMFGLSSAYILAAVREVGLATDQAVRPRPVMSGAVILVFVAFLLLAVTMIRTYRFLRVERILALVRAATMDAIARRDAKMRRLTLAPAGTLELPPDASALTAPASGYLVDVDVRRIERIARRADVRVRISRAVGDYFDEGEVIGWAGRDAGGPVDRRAARRLTAALSMAPVREAELDPAYGIRILSDVAARALSDSYNDSYTARQALQQIRSVLRHLAREPLGDWNVTDRDGRVRVSVMATQLREYLSISVEAPLRFGAGDPDVLDGILEIALEIGLIAPDAEGRATAHQLINRVLEDAMEYGDLRNGRLKRLLAEADLVRACLEDDTPRPDRHARSNWALPASDGPGG
jgi:uncharacterized membrane protein